MLPLAQVPAIGLASGVGFVLPILAMKLVAPGRLRTAALLLAVALAIVLIRRLGRRLHRLLDATERQRRFPLLALYAVMAMAPPAALTLLPWR